MKKRLSRMALAFALIAAPSGGGTEPTPKYAPQDFYDKANESFYIKNLAESACTPA